VLLDMLLGKSGSTVGEKIKSARFMSGLTAIDLSKQLGIHNTTLSRYEQNKIQVRNMDVPMLKRLAILCGMDENYCLDKSHISD
jgi:transcriptional regulator with XRE-family HTH domain